MALTQINMQFGQIKTYNKYYFDIIAKKIRKKVKSPKGFGKAYFTFASILAHAVQNHTQSTIVKIEYLLKNNFTKEECDLEEDDPPIELSTIRLVNTKPCHCNYFYKLKTILTLKINHFIPRCPYYTTYFAFRRTGVHPPLFIH